MEALMSRLSGALAALCLLTACPPIDPVWVTTDALPAPVPADPSDSESSTGALPTTSITDAAPPTTGDLSTSTSSSADESTGVGSTSSGDLPGPDACAPTDEERAYKGPAHVKPIPKHPPYRPAFHLSLP